jgi:hypothetical protein
VGAEQPPALVEGAHRARLLREYRRYWTCYRVVGNRDSSRASELDAPISRRLRPSCRAHPSPDGTLLLCETFSDDGSQNGIHTIRSSDGGGLTQITSNPGGDDIPGDWSPNGKRIVFFRIGSDGNSEGLFVVSTNGTGLKQITPADVDLSSSGSWSTQGNEIVFSRHVTPDVHSSIWVVQSDGTGLHEINVQPASACGGANADPNALGCNEPTWSPDGTKIAFVRSHNNDVDGEIDPGACVTCVKPVPSVRTRRQRAGVFQLPAVRPEGYLHCLAAPCIPAVVTQALQMRNLRDQDVPPLPPRSTGPDTERSFSMTNATEGGSAREGGNATEGGNGVRESVRDHFLDVPWGIGIFLILAVGGLVWTFLSKELEPGQYLAAISGGAGLLAVGHGIREHGKVKGQTDSNSRNAPQRSSSSATHS